jgi:hypothetical protein
MNVYEKNARSIELTIKMAMDNGSEVIIIIPPTVFGIWPMHERILEFCDEMNRKYGIEYHDLSEVSKDPQDYYDHFHHNTEGVLKFARQYLKPILTQY